MVEYKSCFAVVGLGIENGIEYWIGRYSLGTYWEDGYFRIRMNKWNNAVEEVCNCAVPPYIKVSSENLEFLEEDFFIYF